MGEEGVGLFSEDSVHLERGKARQNEVAMVYGGLQSARPSTTASTTRPAAAGFSVRPPLDRNVASQQQQQQYHPPPGQQMRAGGAGGLSLPSSPFVGAAAHGSALLSPPLKPGEMGGIDDDMLLDMALLSQPTPNKVFGGGAMGGAPPLPPPPLVLQGGSLSADPSPFAPIASWSFTIPTAQRAISVGAAHAQQKNATTRRFPGRGFVGGSRRKASNSALGGLAVTLAMPDYPMEMDPLGLGGWGHK